MLKLSPEQKSCTERLIHSVASGKELFKVMSETFIQMADAEWKPRQHNNIHPRGIHIENDNIRKRAMRRRTFFTNYTSSQLAEAYQRILLKPRSGSKVKSTQAAKLLLNLILSELEMRFATNFILTTREKR